MSTTEIIVAALVGAVVLYRTGIGARLIARLTGVAGGPTAAGATVGIAELIHRAETAEVINAVVAKLEREAKAEADRKKAEGVVNSIRAALAGGDAVPKS